MPLRLEGLSEERAEIEAPRPPEPEALPVLASEPAGRFVDPDDWPTARGLDFDDAELATEEDFVVTGVTSTVWDDFSAKGLETAALDAAVDLEDEAPELLVDRLAGEDFVMVNYGR